MLCFLLQTGPNWAELGQTEQSGLEEPQFSPVCQNSRRKKKKTKEEEEEEEANEVPGGETRHCQLVTFTTELFLITKNQPLISGWVENKQTTKNICIVAPPLDHQRRQRFWSTRFHLPVKWAEPGGRTQSGREVKDDRF